MITLQERVLGTAPPEQWRPMKLRYLFRVRRGYKNTDMQETNLLSLSYGRIVPKDIGSAEGLLPQSFESYQIVEPGNIVMRLTDLQNDKQSLRQGLVTQRGIITSAYDAIEVDDNHDPRFWAYTWLSLDLAKYYYSLGGGVRQSVKFGDFPNEWIAVPEFSSQKRIADFLDRETSRIDQLIEKKQKLVKLLEEKRAATITEIVYSGLSPSNHQDINDRVRLRHFIRLNPPKSLVSHVSMEQEITFVPMEAILDGTGGLGSPTSRSFGELYGGSYSYFERGDILLAKVTPCFENGKKATTENLPTQIGFATTEVHVVRVLNEQINRRYLLYLFSTHQFRTAGIASMTGAGGLRRVSEEAILDFRLPVSEVAMQERIASRLDRETARINSLIRKTTHSITCLREFRTALIAAAVTGRLDIDNWRKRGETDHRLEAIAVAEEPEIREEGQTA